MKFIVYPSEYWIRLRQLPDLERPYYIISKCPEKFH
jgi:hypothetical protein